MRSAARMASIWPAHPAVRGQSRAPTWPRVPLVRPEEVDSAHQSTRVLKIVARVVSFLPAGPGWDVDRRERLANQRRLRGGSVVVAQYVARAPGCVRAQIRPSAKQSTRKLGVAGHELVQIRGRNMSNWFITGYMAGLRYALAHQALRTGQSFLDALSACNSTCRTMSELSKQPSMRRPPLSGTSLVIRNVPRAVLSSWRIRRRLRPGSCSDPMRCKSDTSRHKRASSTSRRG
jgi:hypothetical protein